MTNVTCGIFIIDPSDNILVCHATNSSWSRWGIPKGLADASETYREASLRETYEETGISLKTISDNVDQDLKYLGKVKYQRRNKILEAFWIRIPSQIPIEKLICQSLVTDQEKPFPEVDAYKWINIHQAEKYVYKAQQELLPQLIEEMRKHPN